MGLFKKEKPQASSLFTNNDELFISVPGTIHSAGYQEDCVYNYSTGTVHRLSKDDSFQLQTLTRYRSFTEHISLLLKNGWQESGLSFIKEGFKRLQDQGLIITKQSMLNRIGEHDHSRSSEVRISQSAWLTTDRVNELERGINSFFKNNRIFERSVDYLVFDDSKQDKSRQANLDMLSLFAKKNRCPVYYAGCEEQNAFVKKLADNTGEIKVPQTVLDFTFGNPLQTYFMQGSNRNALLCGTIGSALLSTDDDEICTLAGISSGESGIRFSSKYDPNEINYFPDHETLLKNIEFIEEDILHAHEQLLGRSISRCLAVRDGSSQIDISGVTPELNDILQRQDARITATMAGYVGDSGMGSPSSVLWLDGPEREAVMNSRTDYLAAITSRQVLRMVRKNTVTDSSFFMAGNIGLDNRTLLPPFLPMSHSSDGVFGTLIRKTMGNALIGHIPLAILHQPPGIRTFSHESVRELTPRISEIVSIFINAYPEHYCKGDPATVMQGLGKYLIETGSLPKRDFTDLLKVEYTRQLSGYIMFLEKTLRKHNSKPDFWADDLLAFSGSIKDCITTSQFLAPVDLRENRSFEEAALLCQRIVKEFGDLLYWWPAIIQKSRELKESGTTMYKAV